MFPHGRDLLKPSKGTRKCPASAYLHPLSSQDRSPAARSWRDTLPEWLPVWNAPSRHGVPHGRSARCRRCPTTRSRISVIPPPTMNGTCSDDDLATPPDHQKTPAAATAVPKMKGARRTAWRPFSCRIWATLPRRGRIAHVPGTDSVLKLSPRRKWIRCYGRGFVKLRILLAHCLLNMLHSIIFKRMHQHRMQIEACVNMSQILFLGRRGHPCNCRNLASRRT